MREMRVGIEQRVQSKPYYGKGRALYQRVKLDSSILVGKNMHYL